MSARASTVAPTTVITPRRGLFHLGLGELWEARELGVFLAWRDIKVRYKQTVIGAAWAVITPIVLMVVFTFVFGRARNGAAQHVPPPVWYFSALLPWSYFSQAMQNSASSVLSAQQVITKVYFPRLWLPLEAVFPGLVDFAMSFVVLIGLMIAYHIPITTRLLVLPFLLFIAMLTAFGAGLWLSATNALYRDVREGVPFVVQILLFISPVLLTRNRIPPWFRPIYALNPTAGVIEGSRWATTGVGNFPWDFILPGIAFSIVLLLTGLIYFRHIEDVIVDVV